MLLIHIYKHMYIQTLTYFRQRQPANLNALHKIEWVYYKLLYLLECVCVCVCVFLFIFVFILIENSAHVICIDSYLPQRRHPFHSFVKRIYCRRRRRRRRYLCLFIYLLCSGNLNIYIAWKRQHRLWRQLFFGFFFFFMFSATVI